QKSVKISAPDDYYVGISFYNKDTLSFEEDKGWHLNTLYYQDDRPFTFTIKKGSAGTTVLSTDVLNNNFKLELEKSLILKKADNVNVNNDSEALTPSQFISYL